jgi:hypothetical protein
MLLGDPSQNPFSTVSVKMRRTRIEHMLSALPPTLAVKADIRDRQVRVPATELHAHGRLAAAPARQPLEQTKSSARAVRIGL